MSRGKINITVHIKCVVATRQIEWCDITSERAAHAPVDSISILRISDISTVLVFLVFYLRVEIFSNHNIICPVFI